MHNGVVSSFYLPGAGGDAGDEAAGGHLLVEEGVKHAVRLALGKLALHVVGLRRGLQRKAEQSTVDGTEGAQKRRGVTIHREERVWESPLAVPLTWFDDSS